MFKYWPPTLHIDPIGALYNNLPPGGIHSISLVAMRQGQNDLAYLPSVVAGPVDPGICSGY